MISKKTKANLILKAFSLTKVPLLFLTGAKVKEINSQSCTVQMPFKKLVKNHLGSVYFGALAIGADACVGFLAADKIYDSKKNVNLVFKSFRAQFLKRAVGPVLFICDEGPLIDEMLQETLRTGERVNRMIPARAEVQNEIVAEFELELSLKFQQKA